MSQPLSKIPNGFRYYLAREARARRVLETTAMSVFEGWSYEEIVTPTVDYYSLFEQGIGEKEAQRSFRLHRRRWPVARFETRRNGQHCARGRHALCQTRTAITALLLRDGLSSAQSIKG